ncbi:hypothetical protein HPB47_015673 [Ixodes persulcatus]|uniref:Uncharacterized protein n=1 Tax=Ixodes persulcatus TaxID=34615 RepID=A0AC60QSZ9_IXOPE|nr:hypothetical protein HPB47_015673 [Ixodes persulcatus]
MARFRSNVRTFLQVLLTAAVLRLVIAHPSGTPHVLPCGAGEVYETCFSSGCKEDTCDRRITAITICPRNCGMGCVCKKGLVRIGADCVDPSRCVATTTPSHRVVDVSECNGSETCEETKDDSSEESPRPRKEAIGQHGNAGWSASLSLIAILKIRFGNNTSGALINA